MLVEERGKQAVSGGGGANRLLVERELVGGRGKQGDNRGGGTNRLLVEGEGQTG